MTINNTMLPSPHKILNVVQETRAEYTFRVACEIESAHGQFFQLSIPKVGEAPISVSARGDGWVEFTIRKVGRLTEGVFGLRDGDTLFMRGPYGNSFPMETFRNRDLAVIAGGTGLAAVRSLLNHYCERPGEIRSLHLIAGFKDIYSVLFTEDLEKFKSRFNVICTLDDTKAEGYEIGLPTGYIKNIPFDGFEDYNVVVVGPPAMMRIAAEECLARGARESKIWLSFERKMSCAIGKCGHCKINETYVCVDGPIFNYTTARGMID